jgi:peptidyl-prolyl cis-trans isomerase C
MRSIKPLLLAALLTCATLVLPAVAQPVKVNGKEIPQSRIDAGVKHRISQGQPDSVELRSAVREAMINQEIIAQEALKKGLDKSPEVRAQLDLIRLELLVNAYIQDHLRANPITDEMMRKEYERQKAQVGTREFKARHILVEKEEEAKQIIAEIRKGGSFEKIAAERSKDTGSGKRGGELDWALPGNYVKPFADALQKMKKGQMTDAPVQTDFGWHVIRVDDERAFKAPSFEEVRPNLHRSMQQQMVQKVIFDLRQKAKIEQ